MNVRRKLKEIAMELGGHLEVIDVRIGLGYTGVMLENGSTGVAYTFLNRPRGSCSAFQGLRPFAGRKSSELLRLFDAANELESALALATSNAITNREENSYLEGDILAHLKLESDDIVGMVGNFAPIVLELKDKVREIRIFEEIQEPSDRLFSSEQIPQLLPQCQVALVSSTSIINNTVDSILEAAKACREVIMLGASTPLLPEAFKGTQVTLLSGIVIIDSNGILQAISEGGGTRAFRGFAKKVNLRMSQA